MFKNLITPLLLATATQVVLAKPDFSPLSEYIEQTKQISGLSSGTAVAMRKAFRNR